jgi:hypothetical protein
MERVKRDEDWGEFNSFRGAQEEVFIPLMQLNSSTLILKECKLWPRIG